MSFNKGNELYRNNEYEAAIKEFDKVKNSEYNYCSAMHNKAVCLIKLKRHAEAIPIFKICICITGGESKYWFNLGYCNAVLKENKLALIYFNTSLALNNSDGDCIKAIDMIEKVILRR